MISVSTFLSRTSGFSLCLRRGLSAVVLVLLLVVSGPRESEAVSRLAFFNPTHFNVRYGPERRCLLDLWIPKSNGPVPLLVYFHGGGFKQGGKQQIIPIDVQKALENGVAIASAQYPFVHREGLGEADRVGVQDSVRAAARAVQFLRYHADEYGIDKNRVACFGDSAGAGVSLWIGCHDDIADPGNADPVLRESTRVMGVGITNGQFSYDLEKWLPVFTSRFGSSVKMFDSIDRPAFYGLTEQAYKGEEGARARAEVDMISLLSADDPPIIMMSEWPDRRPASIIGFSHHPLHVDLLEKRSREVGLEFRGLMNKVRKEDLKYVRQNSRVVIAFLIEKLKSAPAPEPEGISIEALPVQE